MAGHRINRVSEDIKRELSAIFRKLKDPRISGMITVLRVEVTSDLSYATVHVSTIEGEEKTKESIKGLKSAQGFIRHELGTALRLRHVPELRFVADNSIAYSAEINKILRELHVDDDDMTADGSEAKN
ncbi:MAG: 30S ribosome-binding factor RbfA [Clostridia bacterium]|nr:30S ribosome-binding factor RbfA [Clostridia bacterium]MBQ1554273.1 30S ribosome-binding factor RbfA [Clostridia bacterium]MBQ4396525.1 30S ribosome-binding factor RbfA [Clostridia bacterium]